MDEDHNPRKSIAIGRWYDWLKQGQFYLYGMVYMLVRVAVNVTMSVQPFYLIIVTGFEKTHSNPTPIELALVPLCSYIASTLFSLFLYKRLLLRFKNRQTLLMLSIIVISAGSIPFILLNS